MVEERVKSFECKNEKRKTEKFKVREEKKSEAVKKRKAVVII